MVLEGLMHLSCHCAMTPRGHTMAFSITVTKKGWVIPPIMVVLGKKALFLKIVASALCRLLLSHTRRRRLKTASVFVLSLSSLQRDSFVVRIRSKDSLSWVAFLFPLQWSCVASPLTKCWPRFEHQQNTLSKWIVKTVVNHSSEKSLWLLETGKCVPKTSRKRLENSSEDWTSD